MKPVYKVRCNGTAYFTYSRRSTGTERGTWDLLKPTRKDLSQLPKDFLHIIKKCVDRNKKKYGRSIKSVACALHDAGILCGWRPEYLEDSRMMIWHPKKENFIPFVAFQVLHPRWRKSKPKIFQLLLSSPAIERFVVDTNRKTILWSQEKRHWARMSET